MNARRILDNLNTTISYYKNKSGKFTIPILIIVSKNNLDIADINRFKDFIIQYKEGLPDISTMILEVIPENQIQDLKIGTIMSDLYDKSQLHSIHKKMSRIASNLLNSK